MKNIAILTSGGDAPGMNAAIRAVVRACINENIEVYGIEHGFQGLIENKFHVLNISSVANIIHRGGTILKTARCKEFLEKEGQVKSIANLRQRNIECLIVIGGEGSIKGAKIIHEMGIHTIAIPATIDGDVAGSEYTIGFDTALNTIVEAIDRLRDTAMSHERVFIIEVMGNRSGKLAIEAGISSGADAVLIPELEIDYSTLAKKIIDSKNRLKKHSIVLVAEGAANSYEVSDRINELCEVESKVSVLGHMQRGGTPNAYDRNIASRMGFIAVHSFLNEQNGGVIVLNENKVQLVPFMSSNEYQENDFTLERKIVSCLSI